MRQGTKLLNTLGRAEGSLRPRGIPGASLPSHPVGAVLQIGLVMAGKLQ